MSSITPNYVHRFMFSNIILSFEIFVVKEKEKGYVGK
jgi:hypothetical protein